VQHSPYSQNFPLTIIFMFPKLNIFFKAFRL
jgi:hypothetical protein